MKSNIKIKLDELKTTDIYSMMLFALYKIKEIPEYSTLSELVYLLNKDSLMNLLTYFGGLTITIPTQDELKVVVNALLLYQFIQIEHKELNEAIKLLNIDELLIKDVKSTYFKLSEILDKYDFKRN